MIPVPPAVLEAFASRLSLTPTDLTYLGGGGESSDGIAYTFNHPDGPRVLKLLSLPASDPNALARFEARTGFIHFCGERGADVVYPLEWPGGALYATEPSGEFLFAAYLMEKISGGHPERASEDEALIFRWGKMLGKMHRIAQEYPQWEHAINPATGQPVLGWEEELNDFISWSKDPELTEAWHKIGERLAALPRDRANFGFIHNDPHGDNLLLAGSRMVLLDFDVANFQWFAHDIMIAMQGLLFGPSGGMERPCADPAPARRFLQTLMQGYETENHLDPFFLETMDLFIHYRRTLLFTVMQGWLDTQPDTRASWMKMIMENPKVIN